MRLVFWQPTLSIHQSAPIRALAEMGHDVTLAVDHDLGQFRKEMGWRVPDLGTTRVLVRPDRKTIRDCVMTDPDDSVHILAGTRAYPMVRKVLCHCLKLGVRTAVVAEAADPRGLMGRARRLMYRAEGLLLKGRVEFVLPMGDLGVKWYVESGFRRERCFPYAYAVESPEVAPMDGTEPEQSRSFNIVYVGACIQRKAVDSLIWAVSRIKGYDWSLRIGGDGPERTRIEELTRRLGIGEQVSFLGSLENKDALRCIANSDLLVLPSHHDGWGAVVNESLMLGVPVVCSHRCGASDLIQAPWRGSVYPARSVDELYRALERHLREGKLTPARRAQIRQWSECISGSSVAKYLVAIIEYRRWGGERPVPPWMVSRGIE